MYSLFVKNKNLYHLYFCRTLNLFERMHHTLLGRLYDYLLVAQFKKFQKIRFSYNILVNYLYKVISDLKIRKHIVISSRRSTIINIDSLTYKSPVKIHLLLENMSVHKWLLWAEFLSEKLLLDITGIKVFCSFNLQF